MSDSFTFSGFESNPRGTADAPLRVGTRGSALARAQTEIVVDALRARHADLVVDVVTITTQGDANQTAPLSAIGGRGLFTSEIEGALRAGDVDVAVHSAKDLPSQVAGDTFIAAWLPREDVRDVLVSAGATLAELPPGARVGTSSPRRACQLRALRPDLEILDVRGNVDTRLRKLDAGSYDAILLAAAGLNRLGLAHRIVEHLPTSTMLPAVGQGAIAVQVRAFDTESVFRVAPLNDAHTSAAVLAERAFLARLGAGCMAPTGAHATLHGDTLTLDALVGAMDGTTVRGTRQGPVARPADLGRALAEELLEGGAAALLARAGTRAGSAG